MSAADYGNWTAATTPAACNLTPGDVNASWLDAAKYPGLVVDRAVSPVWYAVGIVGNLVSAGVWLRRRMRRNNSSAVYLATLSVNDTLFLLLHIVQELNYAWQRPTVDFPVVCELYAFVYLVTQYLAPMLVLGFTVERFIAVCYPYQKVRFCTAGRAVKVAVGMVAGCTALGSMQLYLWTYDAERQLCMARPSALVGDPVSLFSVWSWITEMLVFLVVPLFILIVNILVMREVYRMSNAVVESALTSSRLKPSKTAATNAMLLSVSFYVIFTTLPATVIYVLFSWFPEGELVDRVTCQAVDMSADATWQRYVVFYTVSKIVNEICLSHYACNFFLFAVTGLEFRRELCRVLRCGGRSSATSAGGRGRHRRSTSCYQDENGADATECTTTTAALVRKQSPTAHENCVSAVTSVV